MSTATFTIDNSANASGVSGVAFTANFPANLVIASPSNASTTCVSAIYNATASGSSLSFSDARIGAGQSCVVQVDVTSSSVGSYTLTSSNLSTSAGNVAAASASLTVQNTGLQATAGLSVSTIQPNEVTTLTYTFDASAMGVNVISMNLSETFPTGVVLADAPNFITTCTSMTGTFNGGDTSISLAGGTVNAGASCTASIDIKATSAGGFSLSSTTGLYYESGNFSPITIPTVPPVILNVVLQEVSMVFSSFASPGSSVTLDFEIRNTDRGNDITDLNFTSDLNATLSGLSATSLPSTGFCGAGSTVSGTSTLSFSNISLASEATCNFSVTVLVPANAAPGAYTHNTSTINLTRGSATTINAVSTTLRVFAAPTLTISNSVSNVAAGDTYTSTFTLTNIDSANAATALSFTMDIAQILPSASIQTLPAANSCGSGSSFVQTTSNDSTSIFSVSNASLAAGDNCSFDVVISTPVTAATGDYSFTTSTGSGSVNGSGIPIRPVSSSIHVEAAPSLSMVLSEASIAPGGSYDIQFSLTHSASSIGDVTNGSFSLNLGAVASGMAVSSGGQTDMCGFGSSLSGTTNMLVSGITLQPGDTCQFTVSVSVPNDNSLVGSKTLTVSDLSADLNPLSLTGSSVSANLLITGLTFSQEFVPSVTLPDSTIISRYSIVNASGADAASGLYFTHNFSNVLSSMQITSLPASPCGSMVSGTSNFEFSGGSLAGGSTCTFDVELSVPAGASEGSYVSVTSALSAAVGGNNIAIDAASSSLTVELLTVSITSAEASTTSASSIPISINFSRDVTGFEVSDIGVTNGTAVDFSGSGSDYTANINPSSDGNVVISINAGVANDAIDNTVTNPAAQSLTFTYSSTPIWTIPTVSIGAASASSTNTGPITYTLTYTDADQITLGESAISLNKTGTANATVGVSGSGTNTRTITLSDVTGDGTLGISVASNTARHNSGGSAAAAGPSGTFVVDNTKPTVVITDSVAATIKTPFTATFTFSEPVTGFTLGGITANNAVVTEFSAMSSTVYTALISPSSQGSVTVDVAAGVASDSVGNTNVAASQHSVTYDTVAPTVVISGPTTDTNAAFTATFTFSEPVTGFVAGDILATNAGVGVLSATSTSVYTATITPNGEGAVTID
ncbi:hypothetical protein EYR97_08770, partial [Alteromonas sp. KUL42]|uniref:beta strand repeat-containing protein n=1 Tax=Alteromonas sp. KUL42 TaxID=2480797 RepID=UPI00103646F9